MHSLGQTRSAHRANHLLQTPDTFIRAPWPGMVAATAVVHVSPVTGAGFTQYTAELAAGGLVPATAVQRFVYVLEGEALIAGTVLQADDYAYVAAGDDSAIGSGSGARVAVVEKLYTALDGVAPPASFTGRESAVTSQAVLGDPDLQVRALLPADPAFDFAMNTMVYHPGATLPMVEVHVMEHGLLFLEGGGIYRLGDEWYPVTTGDFIYMAPYCPQWFGALGKVSAKYLLYKDWNRAV